MPDRSSVTPSGLMRMVRALSTDAPWVVDVGVAALALLAYSVPFVLPWHAGADTPTWQGYLLVAGIAVALIWRRRLPMTSALTVAVLTAAAVLYHRPGQPMQYGAVVSVFTMAAIGIRWQRRATLALWCAGIVIVGVVDDTSTAVGDAFAVLAVLTAYGLGAFTRFHHAYAAALEERASQLDQQRRMAAERAAATERARIAREMHDILAHAVSLMVVQAEAGPVVVRSDPDRATAAFDAIAAAGRDAMTQLRRILSVLREPGSHADHAPPPTVARLPELIARVRDTGIRVELQVTGDPRPLPAGVDVAAYRVVQEALTNTVKHAAASTAVVRLDWHADAVAIAVSDDGNGAADHVTGHGLRGIRQRAAACGGTASAGPGHDGRGFTVTAVLPAAAQTGVAR